MENMETYWAIANQTIAIINILIEGWLVYSFVKPFMNQDSEFRILEYVIKRLTRLGSNSIFISEVAFKKKSGYPTRGKSAEGRNIRYSVVCLLM